MVRIRLRSEKATRPGKRGLGTSPGRLAPKVPVGRIGRKRKMCTFVDEWTFGQESPQS